MTMSEKKEMDENQVTLDEQAVKLSQKSANTADARDNETPAPVIIKKGGNALGFLALLVALGVGGAGYFFGNAKVAELESALAAVNAKASQVRTETKAPEINLDAEREQLGQLAKAYQQANERVLQLEQAQTAYTNQINGLQSQIQRLLNAGTQNDSSAWLLSDADFLLNNALRKVVLDNDIDTAKSLLVEADSVLSKLNLQGVSAVRNAIQADLTALNGVNKVDQNSLMQHLTVMANRLDDLPILESDSDTSLAKTGQVSDSIDDWQQNLEKSANSFLDNFIRVRDRNASEEKGFVAPNQEVYLRENIRLRLQIAILAIPRQQNELYKKSLEAVSTWIRSYFDTKDDAVKAFLKELDELSEQSIYIDAPEKLQSLISLEQLLNKAPQPVEKVEIKAEQSLNTPSKQEEVKALEQAKQDEAQSASPAASEATAQPEAQAQ